MRLSMCSERDRDLEHDGSLRARPASRERQPAKPAKKERWAHLITRRRDMPRRRICRLHRRRLSGDVSPQDPNLCVILCTLLVQTGRLVVRKVAVRERAESFVCAVEQGVNFSLSMPLQPRVVVRHEASVKAELLDKLKARLLDNVVLVPRNRYAWTQCRAASRACVRTFCPTRSKRVLIGCYSSCQRRAIQQRSVCMEVPAPVAPLRNASTS